MRIHKSVEVIGFGRRFAAYLVDGIVLWIIQFGIMSFAGILTGALSAANKNAATNLNLLLICHLLVTKYRNIYILNSP